MYNIIISITSYPVKIDVEKIRLLAGKYGVELRIQDDTDIREKTMYFSPLDPDGAQNAADSYRLCFMANFCFVLENGKLYTCPTIAHIGYINSFFGTGFEVSEHDYADIYKAENIDDVLAFMTKPMPFCRYCNKRARVAGIKWETSKKDRSEWM